MIKLAFYGKSGSGKSTIAKAAIEYFKNLDLYIEVIKFATPLYKIQKQFYEYANVEIDYYDQNQKLMEDIAKYLREINPNSLVYNFNKSFEMSSADVVINDDVRDIEVDYPYLKKNGFLFIKLECDEEIRKERLLARSDLCSVLDSSTTNCIDQIIPDYVVDTSSSDTSKTVQKLYLFLKRIHEAKI